MRCFCERKMINESKMYHGNVPLEKYTAHRRDIIKMLGLGAVGLGASAIIPNPTRDWLITSFSPAEEQPYFRVLKIDDQTYVEDKILGEVRVFEVVPRIARREYYNSMQALVQPENPFYDKGQLTEASNLAIQLKRNGEELEKIQRGKIENVKYKAKLKRREFLYPDETYLVPRQITEIDINNKKINVKTLDDILKAGI